MFHDPPHLTCPMNPLLADPALISFSNHSSQNDPTRPRTSIGMQPPYAFGSLRQELDAKERKRGYLKQQLRARIQRKSLDSSGNQAITRKSKVAKTQSLKPLDTKKDKSLKLMQHSPPPHSAATPSSDAFSFFDPFVSPISYWSPEFISPDYHTTRDIDPEFMNLTLVSPEHDMMHHHELNAFPYMHNPVLNTQTPLQQFPVLPGESEGMHDLNGIFDDAFKPIHFE
ncbi:hypothetical protein EDD86DRAFT_197511 [Gorgonomyces haynaldii]|nr:hypothetical protein EDD86DRAFT_197511 [Gorgonomyces haynaldii]